MNRPWYHSVSFWLGLSGLAFLIWSWQDSTTRITKGDLNARSTGIGATHISSALRLHLVHTRRGSYRPGWDGQRYEFSKSYLSEFSENAAWGDPDDLLPAPAYLVHRYNPFEPARILVLPHWLLILLHLTAWAGFDRWRWRRKRKIEEEINRIAEACAEGAARGDDRQ